MDRIFYFDDIQGALIELTERLGLTEEIQLPQYKAKSNTRKNKAHYRDILTEEEKWKIEIAFAREIALMGYEF